MKNKINIIFGKTFLVLILLASMAIQVNANNGEVRMGGVNLLKTDVLGNGLPGAGYQIAREATMEELLDSSVSKRLLKTGDQMLTVVYPSFWASKEMTGGKVSEVVTDEYGKASIYGLPYGTYYLVESRPPDGYNRMTAPIRVKINKYSHLTEQDAVRDDENVMIDNTLHIVTIRYRIPDTGTRFFLQLIIPFGLFTISIGIMIWMIQIRKKYIV